jgi:hypothetical protein
MGTRIELPWDSAIDVRLMVFLDSNCSACSEITPTLVRAADRLREGTPPVDTIAIFKGASRDVGQVRSMPQRADMFDRYEIHVTPSALVETRSRGVVRVSLVGNPSSLESLIDWVSGFAESETFNRQDARVVQIDSADEGVEAWS